jgi:KDO2-lipid IV(A) lauroyltransferase
MVNRVTYLFVYPLIYLISILPFGLLYILSDISYFIGFRLLGYRTSLVRENMERTFPEKSKEDINATIKNFYSYFFDLLFESVKALSISKKKVLERVELGDMKALEYYRDKKQSVIIATGHFGNWELGSARYTLMDYPQLMAVYKPLSNPFFDKMISRVRTRFGGDVYAMDDTLDRMREDKNKLTGVALLADQNPSSHNAYWYQLLGRETPVFTGVELLAKRFNYPVIYLRVDRLKRGKYELNCELLADKPTDTAKYEITHEYIHRIERDIRAKPEQWLWTHNRWKRKKDA